MATIGTFLYSGDTPQGSASDFEYSKLVAADALVAFNDLASRPDGIDPGAGQLGGLTLVPGVHKSASVAFLLTGSDLTLDAQGDSEVVAVPGDGFIIVDNDGGILTATDTGDEDYVCEQGAIEAGSDPHGVVSGRPLFLCALPGAQKRTGAAFSRLRFRYKEDSSVKRLASPGVTNLSRLSTGPDVGQGQLQPEYDRIPRDQGEPAAVPLLHDVPGD